MASKDCYSPTHTEEGKECYAPTCADGQDEKSISEVVSAVVHDAVQEGVEEAKVQSTSTAAAVTASVTDAVDNIKAEAEKQGDAATKAVESAKSEAAAATTTEEEDAAPKLAIVPPPTATKKEKKSGGIFACFRKKKKAVEEEPEPAVEEPTEDEPVVEEKSVAVVVEEPKEDEPAVEEEPAVEQDWRVLAAGKIAHEAKDKYRLSRNLDDEDVDEILETAFSVNKAAPAESVRRKSVKKDAPKNPLLQAAEQIKALESMVEAGKNRELFLQSHQDKMAKKYEDQIAVLEKALASSDGRATEALGQVEEATRNAQITAVINNGHAKINDAIVEKKKVLSVDDEEVTPEKFAALKEKLADAQQVQEKLNKEIQRMQSQIGSVTVDSAQTAAQDKLSTAITDVSNALTPEKSAGATTNAAEEDKSDAPRRSLFGAEGIAEAIEQSDNILTKQVQQATCV